MRFLFIILLFISFNAIGQTRLYFPFTINENAINPSFDSWNGTSQFTRAKLNNTKGSTSIAAGTTIGPMNSAGWHYGDRQFVSTRMNEGITFTSGSTTAKGYLMVREFATTDNVDQLKVSVRIVSENGSTVRATLFSVNNYASTSEFINNTSCRNKSFLDGDAVGASYTTVLGDRIVVEIGFTTSGGGTTPEAAAKWGENATDLPENETQTTNGAGWIEFSNTITFAGEAGPTRRVTIIQ